ncbi:helix-turn-helix transcriptional regulator [Streptomyces avicenniae]|uniref:helix-turn-helix transcriptional regulator n=1 Tax=Streptomyces avicenniae TaxID=500153 RepID=UPI000B11BF5D|nr:helix-turn-helix transcriptional regulator [Streptomyces avicenniae]
MHANELADFGVSPTEESVYRHFLRHPDTAADGLHLILDADRDAVRGALGRLTRLGLLRPGETPGCTTAADPETALARLSELRLRAMYQEIQRITQYRHVLDTLRAETARRTAPGQAVEQLDGGSAIHDRMDDLAFFAREEIVSAEPRVRLTPEHAGSVTARDVRALRRGVRRRTVVTAAALAHEPTAAYLGELVHHGARVRVAADMSDHVVVYDRRAALMPLDPRQATRRALLVRDGVLVASLAGLFERIWEQAEDVSLAVRPPADRRPGLSDAELRVLHLMCTVGKDEAGARDLGVSVRTYRRHLADVMRMLGASTRPQAALLARERGWI